MLLSDDSLTLILLRLLGEDAVEALDGDSLTLLTLDSDDGLDSDVNPKLLRLLGLLSDVKPKLLGDDSLTLMDDGEDSLTLTLLGEDAVLLLLSEVTPSELGDDGLIDELDMLDGLTLDLLEIDSVIELGELKDEGLGLLGDDGLLIELGLPLVELVLDELLLELEPQGPVQKPVRTPPSSGITPQDAQPPYALRNPSPVRASIRR